MTQKLKVTATIAYEIRGVRSYKSISYTTDTWDKAIIRLQATPDWQCTQQLLDHNWDNARLRGITFNFNHDE